MGEREMMRGLKELNLDIYNPDKVEGKWQMPIIENDLYVPNKMIGFNEILSYKQDKFDMCVHFYLSDIMFQRIWNQPRKYVNSLRRFEGMLSPDFSVFRDMPAAQKIMNIYRSRLIGQFMQSQGIKVIPTVSWGGPDTYEYCFDGIEDDSVVSVSSIGIIGDQTRLQLWIQGMTELINRKNPRIIIFYGDPIAYNFGSAEVLYFENKQIRRFDNLRAVKRRSTFKVLSNELIQGAKEQSDNKPDTNAV